MHKPLVSVVIPATRDDAYFRQAVQSVLCDGYPNLEVIVIWDGDPEAAPRDVEGARVVVSGRLGTPAANNLGLRLSRGTYVARLDSDDVSLPGRFGAQVKLLEGSEVAVAVATEAKVIDEHGRRLGDYPALGGGELDPARLLKANPVVHSSLMFRRGAVQYNEKCTRMQDYELLLRSAGVGAVLCAPLEGVGYRLHGQQTSRDTRSFWQYMPLVVRAQFGLARRLGGFRRVLMQVPYSALWFAAQLANHYGLRDRHSAIRR